MIRAFGIVIALHLHFILLVMQYKCKHCKTTISANDGTNLNLLPPHMRQAYPVPPRYAAGTFHLRQDAIYGNGDWFFRHLLQSRGRQYLQKVQAYMSQSPASPSMDWNALCNGYYPPNGEQVRTIYESAEYGYSNVERCKRQV